MLLSHAISACEGLSFCWFSAWNQLLGAVGAVLVVQGKKDQAV